MTDPSPDAPAPEPPVFRFATIDSTNSEAMRRGDAGAPHGSAFVADFQTAGRGKPGSEWWMPPGQGVLLSVLLRRLPDGVEFGDLTLEVGRRLAEAVRGRTGLPVEVKLPNDLTVAGRKFAGILCEARWRDDRPLFVVVGAGIDVNVRDFPQELRATATSLAVEAGREFEVEEIVRLAIDAIRRGT